MKTYHGERTALGCKVTVDGAPLRMCSNLSGNATTPFDWGYVGTGQLSLALLSDFLSSDMAAMSMSEVFEREVVAHMPHQRWTMTDQDLSAALGPLIGLNGARAGDEEVQPRAGATSGGIPGETGHLLPTTLKAEDAAANASMVSAGKHVDVPEGTGLAAAHDAADKVIAVADQASHVAAVAMQAYDAAHAADTPADEAMSTANRTPDHEAYFAEHAADKAVTAARKAVDDLKRFGKHK